ncbi:hypothetical protein K6Y31_15630 [Motilimonas cestriensis]|uniref:Uncharacterized protein n=1 Tax=Motilimonas cestriensis TaxID=2742685 RepID=A0ABS8WEW7_9GAMM|nr:hypothetical protein [Motilimonas cestriensis]
MARMFLIPLVISLLWLGFLHYNGLSIKQGAKGFYWIAGLSAFLIGFFTLMLHLTRT